MIYTIALILLFIEALIAWYRPQYALSIALAIILLIPNSIKFNIGINLNVFNLAILFVVISYLKKVWKSRPRYSDLKKILIFYTVYIIVTSFFSAILEDTIDEYLLNIILFIFEYTLLAYVLCWDTMNNKGLNFFNFLLIIVSSIIVVYAFINYVLKYNPYIAYVSMVSDSEDLSNKFIEEQRGILDGRVSSVFTHPLQLGQFIVLIFTYFLYEFREKLHPLVRGVFLTLFFICAVLTGSRAALVPIFVVGLIYMLQFSTPKLLRYIIGGVVLISFVYVNLPKDTQAFVNANVMFWDDRVAEKSDIQGSSKEGRLGQVELAISVISDNPILGKGLKYKNNHEEMMPKGIVGAESIFILTMIEGGFLGLIVFLFFYYKLYKLLKKRCVSKFDISRVNALCMSFFISICLTGISYSFFCIFMIFYMITLYRISCTCERIQE